MNTITIPLSNSSIDFLNSQTSESGISMAKYIDSMLHDIEEGHILEGIMEAEQEFAEGKGLKGDLIEILKNFKNES